MKSRLKRCYENRWSCYMLAFCLLAGCANQEAFRKGQALLDAGRAEEGLFLVKKAVDEAPGNQDYKSYYYRQREIWVNKLLREAETARSNQRWEDAELSYKRVIEIDSVNARAEAGLKAVEAGKRRERLVQEAGDLLMKEDLDGAREKLRVVLAEEPNHSAARALSSRVEQKRFSATTPMARLKLKFRQPVSLELKDTPIKTVFDLLSKAAGVNFIMDRDLKSDLRVSILVKHTTVEDALQNILSTSQLGRRVLNENSILIYPAAKKVDYEELVARTFYLKSVDPKQALTLIKTLVKTKDIFVDDKLNILVMRDTPEAVRLAEKLIDAYDMVDPEVLLEVEVLEVNSDKLREIGARFPNQLSVGVKGAANGVASLTFQQAKNFTSDLGLISFTDPALVLKLHGSDGTSKLLANPQIRVKNHKKAKVHIGDRVPIITSTSGQGGFVSESVSYQDVGLKLEVEPSVTVEDEVSMEVGLEVSSLGAANTSKGGSTTYTIGTRNVSTSLRLKNGETQILAGLISNAESISTEHVPGLSNIPLLGRLFSSNTNKNKRTEIVLLITPHIVRNITPPDLTSVEFSVGTESGNAVASLPVAAIEPLSVAPTPKAAPRPVIPQPAVPQPASERLMFERQMEPAHDAPSAPPRTEGIVPESQMMADPNGMDVAPDAPLVPPSEMPSDMAGMTPSEAPPLPDGAGVVAP